jgi:subtilisin family serine protease
MTLRFPRTPRPGLRHGLHALLTVLVLSLSGGPSSSQAQTRPLIEKAADLPRFSYPVSGKLEELVRSPTAFAPFAAAVRRDVSAVLANHDIPDKATQRDLLGQLAALDYLEGQYDQALARLDQIQALQEKPADKLLSGLRLRAMAKAAKAQGSAPVADATFREAVAENIRQALAPLPFDVIANDIRGFKASAELIGEGLVLGSVRDVLQPIADKSGAISSEFAPSLINARFGLTAVLPLKKTLVDVYTTYLAANQVVKPDIWAARGVSLAGRTDLRPVTVAVWDSGVDTSLFPDQLKRGPRGAPRVIGFDKFARPAHTTLAPIPEALRDKLPQMSARTKGFSDLQSNIDSPEASEVKQFLSKLTPEQFRPAVEEINLAGNYQHGTHVAGIALADNPAARLVVARIEFGHTLAPDPCPSVQLARREVRAYQATVDYLKRHGARVVNMSWGGDLASIEAQLEQCGVGKTPEARKAVAREIFEIGKRGLTRAYASAPGILFVAAAGNSNNDASFTENIPAGIVLPNLLTVGAVDQAGDEAPFTSYGPTVKVHANGYQVESYLPGGSRVALSGTSMAAPQVANLAGKLLAVRPRLKPEALIRLIVDTAERTPDGRRILMHPKKAMEAALAK